MNRGLVQVRKATTLAKSRDPKLLIEGPVQVLPCQRVDLLPALVGLA